MSSDNNGCGCGGCLLRLTLFGLLAYVGLGALQGNISLPDFSFGLSLPEGSWWFGLTSFEWLVVAVASLTALMFFLKWAFSGPTRRCPSCSGVMHPWESLLDKAISKLGGMLLGEGIDAGVDFVEDIGFEVFGNVGQVRVPANPTHWKCTSCGFKTPYTARAAYAFGCFLSVMVIAAIMFGWLPW